jgi:hypothetical protein
MKKANFDIFLFLRKILFDDSNLDSKQDLYPHYWVKNHGHGKTIPVFNFIPPTVPNIEVERATWPSGTPRSSRHYNLNLPPLKLEAALLFHQEYNLPEYSQFKSLKHIFYTARKCKIARGR